MTKLRDRDFDLDEFVDAVASQLDEEDIVAKEQINRAIQVVGREKVCALVAQSNEVFTGSEPLMICDGSRQRTLGGTFFQLLKDSVNTSTRHKIFPWRWEKDST